MTTQRSTYRPVRPPALSRRALLRRTAAVGLAVPALATLASPAARVARAADSVSESLDAVLAAGVTAGLPGVALHIERAGALVYSGAAGVASIELQTPLKTTDRFRIYSITKAFTATVVLQLVDEGVLSLDDPVTKWLDDPAVARIPDTDRITLRQLLNHTSGIYDYDDDDDSQFKQDAFLGPDADWARVWTLPELLAYADGANHAPYFAPGEGFHYSNTGYVLLGLVVEQATGRRFADELRDRILDPLALIDTALAEGGTVPDGTVDGYHLLGGGLVNATAINLSWAWAVGGIVSTAADVARFARAVFAGELVSPASFEEMFTYTPDPNPMLAGFGWGMGVWMVPSEDGERVEAGGGGPGFTASMVRLPEAELTVVALMNVGGDVEATAAVPDEAIRVARGAA